MRKAEGSSGRISAPAMGLKALKHTNTHGYSCNSTSSLFLAQSESGGAPYSTPKISHSDSCARMRSVLLKFHVKFSFHVKSNSVVATEINKSTSFHFQSEDEYSGFSQMLNVVKRQIN